MFVFTTLIVAFGAVIVPVVPSTVICLSPWPKVTLSFSFAVKVLTRDVSSILFVTVIPLVPSTFTKPVTTSLPALVKLLKSFVAELPCNA